MINIKDKQDCVGCHACYNACPKKCIKMVTDSEGFDYPQIDKEYCINCGLCDKSCPLNMTWPQGDKPTAYAAWNRDETVRATSSSGGVFSILMENVLAKDGAIFGVAFNKNMRLCHSMADNYEDSLKFRGSKYLQSKVGNTYKQAKLELDKGREVLFSGTPCQIAGLYSYLDKQYDNLLTCDVVCHGAPSPKVFALYKALLEHRYGAQVKKIAFRCKDCGWRRYSVSLLFNNDTEYREVVTKDPFMQGFLKNIYLRPSCYGCKFKQITRVADISLADFWAVDLYNPQLNDNKGTSLILIQTEKGQNVFENCLEKLNVYQIEYDFAYKTSYCISKSVLPHKKRREFFIDIEQMPFEKVIKKYLMPPSNFYNFIIYCKQLIWSGIKVCKNIFRDWKDNQSY